MRHGLIGLISLASAMVIASMPTAGCSSSDGGTAGTGGSTGTGGTVGSGGSSGTGGSAGTGGSTGTGGARDAGGASSVTSLAATKAVNALTAGEVTQLCNDTYGYFGSAIPKATTCRWRGLSYAASSSAPSQTVLQQNCTTQENNCTQGGDPWANNNGCNDIPATCTATVAQYSACIRDGVAAFIETVTGLSSCSTLMMTNTSAIFDAQAGGTPPASCASLTNACPDLTPPSPLNQ